MPENIVKINLTFLVFKHELSTGACKFLFFNLSTPSRHVCVINGVQCKNTVPHILCHHLVQFWEGDVVRCEPLCYFLARLPGYLIDGATAYHHNPVTTKSSYYMLTHAWFQYYARLWFLADQLHNDGGMNGRKDILLFTPAPSYNSLPKTSY